MYIKGLKLHNYRNYGSLELGLQQGFHVLTGKNGQGKTNLLEALFLCALGRSHRTPRDGELLKLGEEQGLVHLAIQGKGGSRSIRCELSRGERKRVYVDGKAIERSGELMGCLNVVMFSPEDLQLIKGGPTERRRFLDMELSQLRPAYYYDLQQYNLALKQRNNLLKSPEEPDFTMLELWDEQLSKLGARIMESRFAFCKELKQQAGKLHYHMSGGREQLELRYAPDVRCQSPEGLREAIADALCKSLDKDMYRGYTGAGPHRDDIALELNGLELRTFGSQGQQRTAALSLKLSEIELIRSIRGENPVLLLDDVFSELDSSRQRLLLNGVEGCQCFISCTGLEELGELGELPLNVYAVSNGRVQEI